jgi:putative spermidine/putrescine transport system permease protein
VTAYTKSLSTDRDPRTRESPGFAAASLLVAPALLVVVVLFGGGLALGLIQSLAHLPAAGLDTLTFVHFANVLSDPDFLNSLVLTMYVSATSTAIAAALSIVLALVLVSLSEKYRLGIW